MGYVRVFSICLCCYAVVESWKGFREWNRFAEGPVVNWSFGIWTLINYMSNPVLHVALAIALWVLAGNRDHLKSLAESGQKKNLK